LRILRRIAIVYIAQYSPTRLINLQQKRRIKLSAS
jgi:hypothetical protein